MGEPCGRCLGTAEAAARRNLPHLFTVDTCTVDIFDRCRAVPDAAGLLPLSPGRVPHPRLPRRRRPARLRHHPGGGGPDRAARCGSAPARSTAPSSGCSSRADVETDRGRRPRTTTSGGATTASRRSGGRWRGPKPRGWPSWCGWPGPAASLPGGREDARLPLASCTSTRASFRASTATRSAAIAARGWPANGTGAAPDDGWSAIERLLNAVSARSHVDLVRADLRYALRSAASAGLRRHRHPRCRARHRRHDVPRSRSPTTCCCGRCPSRSPSGSSSSGRTSRSAATRAWSCRRATSCDWQAREPAFDGDGGLHLDGRRTCSAPASPSGSRARTATPEMFALLGVARRSAARSPRRRPRGRAGGAGAQRTGCGRRASAPIRERRPARCRSTTGRTRSPASCRRLHASRGATTAFWTPLRFDGELTRPIASNYLSARRSPGCAPGVTIDQVAGRAERHRRAARARPTRTRTREPARRSSTLRDEVSRQPRLMLAALRRLACVLLIACTNLGEPAARRGRSIAAASSPCAPRSAPGASGWSASC